MAIKIGTIDVNRVAVGSAKALSVYIGTEKIWGIIPTEVKYTAESGLPVWTGNIEGALVGSTTAPNTQIPNVASSEEITLGNGVTTIGNRAFLSCATLKSIYIPDNVYAIGINCFESCSQLSGVVVPKDITAIPNWAFYRCSSLQSVGLPDGLSSIGAGSFHTCTSLANITMPSGLVDIGNNAFNGCSGLAVIDMSNATQVPTIGQYTFYNTNNSFRVIVPQNLYDQWTQAQYWSSITGRIVPSTSIWLGFTAQEANSTIRLDKVGTPDAISLETSTDGVTWTDYGWTSNTGDTLTMTNIGDKVYVRAKTENQTIGSSTSNYYRFVGTGLFGASGNIQSLLNKYGSRTDAPSSCYRQLFQNCTSLTSAPELPATTLGNSCYVYMFDGCTSLTTAPVLPATTLAITCYGYMFQNCTSLTQAPELPATTLVYGCYRDMFHGCSGLSSITVGFSDWQSTNTPTTSWVTGVAASGEFNCPAELSVISGANNIPTNWIVNPINALCFTAEEANSTVAMEAQGSAPTVSLEYSTNGSTWSPFVVGTTTVTLANIGDKVYIRATSAGNTGFATSSSDYNKFVMTGKIATSGNVNTLLDQNGNATLTRYCYSNMFRDCTSLTTPPTLPATTLANNCYASMFYGCTSLTTAPVLPATVLADGCYWYMFKNCTSLTTAPALPATTLSIGCYRTMFQGCSNLNNITLGYTGNFADAPTNAFDNWVDGVASTGTFYYNGSDTTTGASAIPTGWTVTPLTP